MQQSSYLLVARAGVLVGERHMGRRQAEHVTEGDCGEVDTLAFLRRIAIMNLLYRRPVAVGDQLGHLRLDPDVGRLHFVPHDDVFRNDLY